MRLLGALVNPGPNQSDFIRSQRLWWRATPARTSRASAGSARTAARAAIGWGAGRRATAARGIAWCGWGRSSTRSAWRWPTARATRAASTRFGRHGGFGINARRRNDQQTVLAVARNNHFSLRPALQDAFE